MAKPYGDDLRRKFLWAYDQGEETLEELADRFLVSVGWAERYYPRCLHSISGICSAPRRSSGHNRDQRESSRSKGSNLNRSRKSWCVRP